MPETARFSPNQLITATSRTGATTPPPSPPSTPWDPAPSSTSKASTPPTRSTEKPITEPPDTRGTGPAAMYATARWLRTAFSDLAWKVHDVAHDNDLVVVHATMSGRQTGPFVAYRPDGEIAAVFPPRGRTFAVTQTHWFRMRDGRVAEHWANRDDLGMGQQLGWNPPTPLYLARMLLATRRARRR